jgi:alkanesulfonate monooxygenase SsuD/methylene tetrahydromethanopterin reductase-like flavin-dependent oxidoreductase (luciferase family)
MALNLDAPVPSLEEAARHVYTEEERRYVLSQRDRAVIGGPERCRRELGALVERYGANELMVITITGDYATRLRSYELLGEAFGLG